jgi:hypothetical protein
MLGVVLSHIQRGYYIFSLLLNEDQSRHHASMQWAARNDEVLRKKKL